MTSPALSIPFDEARGIIPNDGAGRIVRPPSALGEQDQLARRLPGLYCAGWVKRGPTGVIASTMLDAFSTAEAIAADWEAGREFLHADDDAPRTGWGGVRQEVDRRGLRRVSWEDWLRIDAVERRRGRERGKEREKFACVADMLRLLD